MQSFRQFNQTGVGRTLFRVSFILGAATLLLAVMWLSLPRAVEVAHAHPPMIPPAAVGDEVTRIQCVGGLTATVFADNLISPDGLAFSPSGELHVVEESVGRVVRITGTNIITELVGLTLPEGIAFDKNGTFYVTEDNPNGGRVVAKAPISPTTGTAIAGGFEAPEGIVWVDDGSATGVLYITESNIEKALADQDDDPDAYRTRVTKLELNGTQTRLITQTGIVTPVFSPLSVSGTFWSYSGITVGSDGLLYFANELINQTVSGQVDVQNPLPPFNTITVPFSANSVPGGVFSMNPTVGASSGKIVATANLKSAEGVRFSTNGAFPLYVAEETTGEFNTPPSTGRLSQVDASGNQTEFCTGFLSIEDVVLDDAGNIYVSEDGADGSSSGRVLRINAPSLKLYLPLIRKS